MSLVVRLSTLGILSLSVACTEVKSSAVNTNGMYVDYEVVTEGEGTGSSVNTTLRVGGLTSTTFVDLDAGDQLVVTVGEESQALSQQSLGVLHSYQGTFGADTEGSAFVLSFDRVDLDNAPSTTTNIPDAFTIETPELDASFSRSSDEDLLISWDTEGEHLVKIIVEGSCFVSYIATAQADVGTHSIPMSYFQDNEYDSTSSCESTITVDRQRFGTVDAAFGGGQAIGVQRRTVSIRMEP